MPREPSRWVKQEAISCSVLALGSVDEGEGDRKSAVEYARRLRRYEGGWATSEVERICARARGWVSLHDSREVTAGIAHLGYVLLPRLA